GFPSPARTTIVASTHRLYSIHEKIVTGRGIYSSEDLQRAARAFSRALYAFDALALAREHGTEANAVLLGALAAAGALPIRADAFREAIRRKGVQVGANLRGFDAGLAAAQRLTSASAAPAPLTVAAGRPAAATDTDAARLTAGFPAELRPVLGQAIERLTEYQNGAYVERYLARLRPFVALDDPTLLAPDAPASAPADLLSRPRGARADGALARRRRPVRRLGPPARAGGRARGATREGLRRRAAAHDRSLRPPARRRYARGGARGDERGRVRGRADARGAVPHARAAGP